VENSSIQIFSDGKFKKINGINGRWKVLSIQIFSDAGIGMPSGRVGRPFSRQAVTTARV
jgi:hypothetical protein